MEWGHKCWHEIERNFLSTIMHGNKGEMSEMGENITREIILKLCYINLWDGKDTLIWPQQIYLKKPYVFSRAQICVCWWVCVCEEL